MEPIKGDIERIVRQASGTPDSWESPVCRVCGNVGEPRRKAQGYPAPTICRACNQVEEFAARLPDRIREAGIPKRFESARREDVPEPLWDRLCPWLDGGDSFALLYGPTGTGKSHIAAAVLRAALVHAPFGFWTSVPTMTLRLRRVGADADELMDKLIAAPCLVLDDLGAERSTDYALEMLSSLILNRWDRCARTLVTTNARPEQLHEIHPRMASRLASGIMIGLDGVDRRL